MQAEKKIKKASEKCNKHNFQLSPLHDRCYFQRNTVVSFCKKSGHSGGKIKNQKTDKKDCLDCCVFNLDKNHTTYSFVLNSEKVRAT